MVLFWDQYFYSLVCVSSGRPVLLIVVNCDKSGVNCDGDGIKGYQDYQVHSTENKRGSVSLFDIPSRDESGSYAQFSNGNKGNSISGIISFSVIGPTGAKIWPIKGLSKNLALALVAAHAKGNFFEYFGYIQMQAIIVIILSIVSA